jgi:hypothetical protein
MRSLRLERESSPSQQTQSLKAPSESPLKSLLGFPLPPLIVTHFLMVLILFASPSEVSCRGDWNLSKCEERHLH